MLIKSRAKLYDNFPKENLNFLASILRSYSVGKSDLDGIKDSVENFIFENHKYNSDGVKTELSELSLVGDDFYRQLLTSPAITPNGIIKPKVETLNLYQEICRSFFSLMQNLGVFDCYSKLALPNVRIKAPAIYEKEDVKVRPYYTGKLHSDAWVGHVSDSIILLILFGDLKNTVEFFEPIKPNKYFFAKAESFESGIARVEGTAFLTTMKKNQMYVMDHGCIHRTKSDEKNSGFRISIDCAAYLKNNIGVPFTDETYSYYPSGNLENLGKSWMLRTKDEIYSNKREGVTLEAYVTHE
tara:strand:- start:137190 stop:138083 length:894 start_codon:yes stop_codon:yes gene_type:complete